MKFIICISIFCLTIAACMAAVGRGVYKDPSHPGKCFIEGLILSPGEDAKDPTSCQKIFCYKNSEVQIHSCGSVGPPPGFKLGNPTNANGPYPDCCHRELVEA